MKNWIQLSKSSRIVSLLLAMAVTLLLPEMAQGAVTHYYWDCTATIGNAGFGTAGYTWGTNARWTQNTAGTGTGVLAIPTGDAGHFGCDSTTLGLAAGTVNVNGTVTVGGIFFSQYSGSIVLSGGSISCNGNINVDNCRGARKLSRRALNFLPVR